MATGSALRAGVMRRRGASTRIAAGLSKNPKAGRAAYATRRIPQGGFIALYAGDWEYLEEPRPYRGTNPNVVDCNDWRIKPPICKKIGKVSAAKSRCTPLAGWQPRRAQAVAARPRAIA